MTTPARPDRRAGAFDIKIAIMLMAACHLFTAPISQADPITPRDDDQVLETLPRSLRSLGTTRDELTALRQQLSEDPTNFALAATVATDLIARGKSTGDPRFFGYARAAITDWWEAPAPPNAILKVRAELRETDHQYDLAISDLTTLLERNPRDVQAWIELSNIQRVQGRFDEAQRASDQLASFAGTMPTTLSRIPLMAATGEAEAAYDFLVQLRPDAEAQWSSTVDWIIIMQAQITVALGRNIEAEAHFREGIQRNPTTLYLRRAFADFLLDQDRSAEAIRLVRDDLADTGMLLSAAIAARRTGHRTEFESWRDLLKYRFDEIRQRGGQPHGRYESRWALELADDPQRALEVGLANWEIQKEVWDARNVLAAALAADDPEAARGVVAFIRRHQIQDVTLEQLMNDLEHEASAPIEGTR